MKTWVTSLVLLFSLGARAESPSILISDIDDTLKVSKIGTGVGTAVAFFGNEAFPGMTRVYNELKVNNPSLDIHYVSRAPSEIAWGRHTEFLEVNGFPAGELHLPSLFNRDNFKVNEISAILSSAKPGLVILIGDNVEQDPEVYREIRRLFEPRGFRFVTYIHALRPVTPAALVRTETTTTLFYKNARDLARDLMKLQILTRRELTRNEKTPPMTTRSSESFSRAI